MNNPAFDISGQFGSIDKLSTESSSIVRFDNDGRNANECFLVSSNQQLLTLKNFSGEIRALRDVEQFIDQSTILLDVSADSLEQLLITVIEKVI
jgi:hypothetical protein